MNYQLESVIELTHIIVLESRRKLDRVSMEGLFFLEELRGEQEGRLVCPFCLYSTKHSKTSAIIRRGRFVCFNCNKKGAVPK